MAANGGPPRSFNLETEAYDLNRVAERIVAGEVIAKRPQCGRRPQQFLSARAVCPTSRGFIQPGGDDASRGQRAEVDRPSVQPSALVPPLLHLAA